MFFRCCVKDKLLCVVEHLFAQHALHEPNLLRFFKTESRLAILHFDYWRGKLTDEYNLKLN